MSLGTLPRCERDYQENKLHGSFAPVRIPHNRSIRFLEVFCHTDEVTFKANVAFSLTVALFTVRATEWQKRKDCFGKTLKPWPVFVDHIWTPRVLQVLVRYGLRPYIRRR